MRFLLDVHLPPALASAIRAAGHECDEARLLIPPDSLDVAIAALANSLGAVVMSKDLDFVALSDRGILRTALVHIRLPNMMAQETCAAIIPRLPSIAESIGAGERVVEVQ